MSQRKKNIRALFRTAVFSRDQYQCAVCGSTEALDAHHITDRGEMSNGGYVPENGITLCSECHKKAEFYHASGKAFFKKGFLPEDLYRLIESSLEQAESASQ